MAVFENVIDWVMAHEGGFVDRPKDPGGPTNFGISLRYLEKKGQKGDVDGDGDVDRDDITALSFEQAKEFIKEDFWIPLNLDQVESDPLAGKILDLAVNNGPGTTVKMLQEVVNGLQPCWLKDVLKVDGALGPKTLAAVNELEWQYVRAFLCAAAWLRYQDIMKAHKNLRENFNGWKRRAFA